MPRRRTSPSRGFREPDGRSTPEALRRHRQRPLRHARTLRRGALRRGRRRYSTCLSGAARRRQAARIEAIDELAETLENETRRLFGGLTLAELTPPLGADGRPPPLRLRTRTASIRGTPARRTPWRAPRRTRPQIGALVHVCGLSCSASARPSERSLIPSSRFEPRQPVRVRVLPRG